MKKNIIIAAAVVGAGAFFLMTRKASAARSGGEAVDPDTDRLVDSIPGAPPAPVAGAPPRAGTPKPSVIAQAQQGVTATSRALSTGALALASAAGRLFGGPERAGTLGGP